MKERQQRLRAARAFRGLSQPELADLLEMSEKTYKLTELGQRRPKRSELLAIAEACDVPMWFLEGGWDGWRALGDIDAEAQAAIKQIEQRSSRKRTA